VQSETGLTQSVLEAELDILNGLSILWYN